MTIKTSISTIKVKSFVGKIYPVVFLTLYILLMDRIWREYIADITIEQMDWQTNVRNYNISFLRYPRVTSLEQSAIDSHVAVVTYYLQATFENSNF